MNPVARTGDVSATASSAKNYPNDTAPTATGSWAVLGKVFETPASVAESDARAIVISATCQFSFTGTTTSGASFTSPPSTVTLNPTTRKLKVGGSYPLVNGDEAPDAFGNKLSVSSTATWQTA
jgi:uncharacterized protein YjdB